MCGSLFYGPPRDLIEQIGNAARGEWDLALLQAQAKKEQQALYFVCSYKGSKAKLTLKVPQAASKCVLALAANGETIAGCY